MKRQVYWPDRKHKPISKDEKVSCDVDKSEGQRNREDADILSTTTSGSVGVESDWVTNSSQFYSAFGISCEYLAH